MPRYLATLALAAALGSCGTLRPAPDDTDVTADADAPQDDDAGPDAGDSYSAAVLADKPIAYWRLDDRPDSGTAKDVMNFANGTYRGGCTLGKPGIVPGNTAVQFNNKDCLVDLGAQFQFEAEKTFSIEAWAQVESDGFKHIFTHEQRDGSPTNGYALLVDTKTDCVAERIPARANFAMKSDAFNHLVMTYDGTSLRLYVNGDMVRMAGSSNPVPAFSDPKTVIGATGNDMLWFDGVIDEVAVYDKALTPDRVKAHFTAAGP
jgi:hypothetical protein